MKTLPPDLNTLTDEDFETFDPGEYHPDEVDRLRKHLSGEVESSGREARKEELNQQLAKADREMRAKRLQQQTQEAHTKKVRMAGLLSLGGTLAAGGALYGGKKLYDHYQGKEGSMKNTDLLNKLAMGDAPGGWYDSQDDVRRAEQQHRQQPPRPNAYEEYDRRNAEAERLHREHAARREQHRQNYQKIMDDHDRRMGEINDRFNRRMRNMSEDIHYTDGLPRGPETSAGERLGRSALLTALGVGAGYGGYKLYQHLNNPNNKQAEEQSMPLSEEDLMTIRLLSMPPEERALHMQSNPQGGPMMHPNQLNQDKMANAVGDFVRKNVLRRSPEYIKKRNEIAVRGKALKETKLLEHTERKHGLRPPEEPTTPTAPKAKEPGFIEKHKWPLLGAGALAAGGYYAYDKSQQQSQPQSPYKLGYAQSLSSLKLAAGASDVVKRIAASEAKHPPKVAPPLPKEPPKPQPMAEKVTDKKPGPMTTQGYIDAAVARKRAGNPPMAKVVTKSAYDAGYQDTMEHLKLATPFAGIKNMWNAAKDNVKGLGFLTPKRFKYESNAASNKFNQALSGADDLQMPRPYVSPDKFYGSLPSQRKGQFSPEFLQSHGTTPPKAQQTQQPQKPPKQKQQQPQQQQQQQPQQQQSPQSSTQQQPGLWQQFRGMHPGAQAGIGLGAGLLGSSAINAMSAPPPPQPMYLQ
jgi:hypothetical protein